jgi:hypothetical protein
MYREASRHCACIHLGELRHRPGHILQLLHVAAHSPLLLCATRSVGYAPLCSSRSHPPHQPRAYLLLLSPSGPDVYTASQRHLATSESHALRRHESGRVSPRRPIVLWLNSAVACVFVEDKKIARWITLSTIELWTHINTTYYMLDATRDHRPRRRDDGRRRSPRPRPRRHKIFFYTTTKLKLVCAHIAYNYLAFAFAHCYIIYYHHRTRTQGRRRAGLHWVLPQRSVQDPGEALGPSSRECPGSRGGPGGHVPPLRHCACVSVKNIAAAFGNLRRVRPCFSRSPSL